MLEDKQVHSTVVRVEIGWVNFIFENGIVFNLKGVCDSTLTLFLYKALFEDQRSISVHSVCFSPFLAYEIVYYNIDFFYWLKLRTIKLHVHLYNLSCLFGNHIIKLACEVFRWEAKVLSEHHMP